MKKREILLLLILIFAVVMMFTSCNKYIVTNVYEKSYKIESVAISDVYTQLNAYSIDSIHYPLNEWITNFMNGDSTQIRQQILRKQINDKSGYQFVFTTHIYVVKCICPERFNYNFLIRYSGKEKDLK